MGNMLSQAAGVLAFLFNGKPAMCRLGLFVSTGDTIQTLSRWEHWRRTRQIADIPISSDPCWSLLDLVLKIWTASDTTWVEMWDSEWGSTVYSKWGKRISVTARLNESVRNRNCVSWLQLRKLLTKMSGLSIEFRWRYLSNKTLGLVCQCCGRAIQLKGQKEGEIEIALPGIVYLSNGAVASAFKK